VDENPDKLGELINFSKQSLVFKIVTDSLKFQGPAELRDVTPDVQLQNFLRSFQALPEKERYHLVSYYFESIVFGSDNVSPSSLNPEMLAVWTSNKTCFRCCI
jgi:hypothetical protein